MSNIFDTATLIESIKRTAKVPDDQSEYTEQDIIDMANEELFTNLIAKIVSKKETYYTINNDVPVEQGVNKYKLPNRSIGSKIEWVGVYSEGSENNPGELDMVTYDQLSRLNSHNYRSSGSRFYFENESIVIDSQDSNVDFDYIRFRFNIRPNKLVLSSRVVIITGIDPTTGTITIATDIPTNFTSVSKIDFICSDEPNNILNYDIEIVDLNSTAKFFQIDPEDVPQQLVVGDRICLAGESDVIYAPVEFHPILAEMVALRILGANGDDTRLVERQLERKLQSSDYLITNRDSSSPVKASARRNGLLRRRRR